MFDDAVPPANQFHATFESELPLRFGFVPSVNPSLSTDLTVLLASSSLLLSLDASLFVFDPPPIPLTVSNKP